MIYAQERRHFSTFQSSKCNLKQSQYYWYKWEKKLMMEIKSYKIMDTLHDQCGQNPRMLPQLGTLRFHFLLLPRWELYSPFPPSTSSHGGEISPIHLDVVCQNSLSFSHCLGAYGVIFYFIPWRGLYSPIPQSTSTHAQRIFFFFISDKPISLKA